MMRRPISYLLLVAAVALATTQLAATPPNSNTALPFLAAPSGLLLIAHAGSGLPQGTYSNSLNAMDRAVANGFELIEIDFSWTNDRKIVAIHDWDRSYFNWFKIPLLQQAKHRLGFSPNVPDLATFNNMRMRFDLHHANLQQVMGWLEAHPSIKIVTDFKQDNLIALQAIADDYPELINQIIPQIYTPDEYTPVIAMGWADIIFTTYRSDLSTEKIVDFANTHALFALTVPTMPNDGRYKDFANLETRVFTHTINQPDNAAMLKNIGFSGLYTDFLLPQR